jgi:hypothetical protein
MRASITWSVLVLSVSVASPQIAGAQDAKRLFFEADMVRHALEGQAGPFCVLANQFKRKEAVAWRIRVLDQTGQHMDDKTLKSVVVELSDGQKLNAKFGGPDSEVRIIMLHPRLRTSESKDTSNLLI